MCGINGFIRLDNKIEYSRDWMNKLVHGMNERIKHRGPNAEGLYTDEYCSLGMRRLSIIDLNKGSQPIYNADRTKCIIFNGEIYNYRELRDDLTAEGCVFQTQSDTEVVLLGVEKYGKEFINKLDGMFAFCIYDLLSHIWMIVRDRTGEKPLYYYRSTNASGDNAFFLFGSELKSLLETGLIEKKIDTEALTTYFQLGYIPAPLCIIKGVKKLMPANIIEIKADSNDTVDIYTERYWKLKIDPDEKYLDYDYCKKELKEKLYASVQQRMISDVPLGAFLSSGFDSAIIVGIMSQMSSSSVDTFTIGFKEKSYDESRLAEITAKKNGTNHHKVILDWNEAVKGIDELLDNIDEPFADPSLVASYAVSKMTKEYVTVALSGDASDELFAGYNKYLIGYYSSFYKRVPRVVRYGIIEPITEFLPIGRGLYRKVKKVLSNADAPVELQAKRLMCRAFKYNDVVHLLPGIEVSKMNFIKKQFEGLEVKDLQTYTNDSNSTGMSVMRENTAQITSTNLGLEVIDTQKRIQYIDFSTVLEGQMLPKVDRASMRASLEVRVPMLDRRVVELAFNMPSKFKINRTERKIILKDTFKDLLPDELFKAPKHGFDVPVGIWMDGMLKKRLDKYSSEEYIKTQGLFNKSFIAELRAERKIMDIDWSTKLWSFFVFQNWYERYIAT